MIKVVIESPFAGDVVRNVKYARLCLADSLKRGEGIKAGLEWGRKADLRAVYIDYGITKGMEMGIKDAKKIRQPIEYRRILDNEKI